MASDQSDDRLRLLYLDWCSTKVAKRFLELSVDEVWQRSNFAASLPPPSGEQVLPERDSAIAVERIPGYLDLVRKTALLLAREMNLPSFPEWKEEYLEDPESFKKEILGR
jgi:hypothetical protein